jgi:hypothetical protein
MSAHPRSSVIRAALALAHLGNPGVGGPPESLVEDRMGLMPMLGQQVGEFSREVLVDLEPHAASSPGIRKMRSLARSAAYAMEA